MTEGAGASAPGTQAHKASSRARRPDTKPNATSCVDAVKWKVLLQTVTRFQRERAPCPESCKSKARHPLARLIQKQNSSRERPGWWVGMGHRGHLSSYKRKACEGREQAGTRWEGEPRPRVKELVVPNELSFTKRLERFQEARSTDTELKAVLATSGRLATPGRNRRHA